MLIPYFQVSAFTKRYFGGNPAGVCLLTEWLPDTQMQAIAAENNLSETAFLIEGEDHFDVRWLSPTVEIDLCGHATLASAHVIFNHYKRKGSSIRFQSRGGDLRVDRMNDQLVLDFPAQPAMECEAAPELLEGLRARPKAVLKQRDYYAIFDREEDVAAAQPNLEILARLDDVQGVVVTAPGNECDFVSRYFAPQAGIPEDPVTGSTHCVLIPYWANRLGKTDLRARQLSKRGGELFCHNRGERVGIGGNAVTYVEGKLHSS